MRNCSRALRKANDICGLKEWQCNVYLFMPEYHCCDLKKLSHVYPAVKPWLTSLICNRTVNTRLPFLSPSRPFFAPFSHLISQNCVRLLYRGVFFRLYFLKYCCCNFGCLCSSWFFSTKESTTVWQMWTSGDTYRYIL